MALFRNKYRIESARMPSWDYGSNAAYFITICTESRHEYFGNVADHEMLLSPLGDAANRCWQAIPDHFPFVILDAFVVMPNHVHGIVIIDKPVSEYIPVQGVETQNLASLLDNKVKSNNHFGPQSRNIASIIRGYKIGVTKCAKSLSADFKWQPRFHDHVIRNKEEYVRIYNYIISNPANRQKDKFYSRQEK